MLADIEANKYLEYGTHQGAMYGTKLDTIRDNLNKGLTAILDVEPQVTRPLISVEYPFLTHLLLKIQWQFPLNPIQTGLFWSICDWGGAPRTPPLYLWNQ